MQKLRKTGKRICSLNESDFICNILYCNSDDKIVLFTSSGKYLTISPDSIKELQNNATKGYKGIKLKNEDFIVSATCISDKDMGIIITDNKGKIKKIKSDIFLNKISKRNCIGLKCIQKDSQITSCIRETDQDMNIAIITKQSRIICIQSSAIPEQGRHTKGVKAIDMEKDDSIIYAFGLS